MIKINGVTITSAAQFREHFDFEVARKIIGRIAHDNTLFTTPNDVGIQQMLARLLDRETEGFSVRLDEHATFVLHDEADDSEAFLSFFDSHDEAFVKTFTAPMWEIVLLHELAHRPTPRERLQACMEMASENDTLTGDAGEIVLHADQQLELVLFEPETKLRGRLRTVKIVNGSGLSGYASVVVKASDGTMVDVVRLRNKECLFANFLGDRLVELLPRMTVSRSHCNYFCFTDSDLTVGRYLFATGATSVYSPADCRKITQCCADEENGFVAVSAGQLLPFTSLLNPIDDFDFSPDEDEHFVKVVMNGRMLLALTDKGRTFSNYGDFALAGLDNVVSVGLEADYSFYVLTADARLLLSKPNLSVPTENVYAVNAQSAASYSVRTRDGMTHFSGGQTSTSLGRQVKTVAGIEIKMDPLSGHLMAKGAHFALDHEVDDFALLDDPSGNGRQQLLVYYQSKVECLNLIME